MPAAWRPYPANHRARDHHSRALAIARDIRTLLEPARALEGIGRCHLPDGHHGDAGAHRRQALTIYQYLGVPAAAVPAGDQQACRSLCAAMTAATLRSLVAQICGAARRGGSVRRLRNVISGSRRRSG
jgi:hypothetical protein